MKLKMNLSSVEFSKLSNAIRIKKRLEYYRKKTTGVPVAYIQDVSWLIQMLKKCEKKLDAIDDALCMATAESLDYMAWATMAKEEIGELLKEIRE